MDNKAKEKLDMRKTDFDVCHHKCPFRFAKEGECRLYGEQLQFKYRYMERTMFFRCESCMNDVEPIDGLNEAKVLRKILKELDVIRTELKTIKSKIDTLPNGMR